VIDPGSGVDRLSDVLIRGGRVEQIGPGLDGTGCRVVDAAGCLVTPGLVDPHVHLREPGFLHKEDIASGTLAAVAGGFSTVCCMPNTRPALDSPEVVRWIERRAAETGCCRVFSVSAGTVGRHGKELADIAGVRWCRGRGDLGRW
jgi:dihydroorotase